ncbi:hypothetical protein RRF57_012941 [Xylaria bambusicola]|uniref:Uncharacterized protein n=1 Tax=Xylaria bambusicola TaxID=326684 RepID=A0AAN7UQQ2_9PEZI
MVPPTVASKAIILHAGLVKDCLNVFPRVGISDAESLFYSTSSFGGFLEASYSFRPDRLPELHRNHVRWQLTGSDLAW